MPVNQIAAIINDPALSREFKARKNILLWIGLIFTLAIALRILLFIYFPLLLTNDSGDYLAAAHAIAYNLDFRSPALRDWRMPGYPVFLALALPLTHMHSNRIVILQSTIGLVCVALGMWIGRLLKKPFVSIILGLFLAANPVYLLFEHLLLSEGLFLFILLLFITVWVWSWQEKINWLSGTLLGLISAAGILTRANSLVFFAACILGLYLFNAGTEHRGKSHSLKAWGIFSTTLTAGLLVLLAPWVWRNYQLYQAPAITNLTYRNTLLLKGMLGRLDTTLPIYQETSRQIGLDEPGYAWINALNQVYPTREAEMIAQRLLFEQLRYHPWLHLLDTMDSFLCFGGLCLGQPGERESITHWFTNILINPQKVSKRGTVEWAKLSSPDYVFVDTRHNPLLLLIWSKIGVAYLTYLRPVLFFLTLILGGIVFLHWKNNRSRLAANPSITLPFVSAYALLAAAHALTTAGFDRFAAPFDIAAVLCLLMVLTDSLT